jgi:hypothetical protein
LSNFMIKLCILLKLQLAGRTYGGVLMRYGGVSD